MKPYLKKLDMELNRHLYRILNDSDHLIKQYVINKFVCKYDKIDNYLYLTLKITKDNKYEYVKLSNDLDSMSKNYDITKLIEYIEKYIEMLNNKFIYELSIKHRNYRFIDYNKYEILSEKII